MDATNSETRMTEDVNDSTNNMAELIDQVVGPTTKWAGQRASKMSLEDLLELLSAFHDQGIHFA